jgi:hypothetical protein
LATFKGAAVGSVYTKKAARSTTSLVIIVSIQYLHDYLETAGIGDDVGGQESPEWAGMHEAVSAGIRNMPDHIASLIPFVRRKRLAGRLVKNPTLIPSCIMNQ